MPQIEQRPFGRLGDGRHADLFTLRNDQGFEARITNYGGILTHLLAPDRHGDLDDVVLGFDTLGPYLSKHPFFGALIGRVAGRITGGTFELEGKRCQLALNNPPNHIHGGHQGLDKRLWSAHAEEESLLLEYLSPDGEEGYPGNLRIAVRYSISDQNELRLDYHATSDHPTPVSLTNHSYFNLDGEGSGDMLDHQLEIRADRCVLMDSSFTTINEAVPVDGGAQDFRLPASIGERLDQMGQPHGYLYLLGQKKADPALVAKVTAPRSGRTMEVFTNETCLQFYTARFLDGSHVGKSGKAYPPYAALCLECQGYPDAPNAPDFPSIILHPGETYRQTTIYKLSTDG